MFIVEFEPNPFFTIGKLSEVKFGFRCPLFSQPLTRSEIIELNNSFRSTSLNHLAAILVDKEARTATTQNNSSDGRTANK